MALFMFIAAVTALLVLYALHGRESRRPKERDYGLVERSRSRYSSLSVFERLGLSPDECGTFRTFVDRFATYEDVVAAIKGAGIVRSDLIVGIDFSASNEWQGRRTFGVRCLHDTSNPRLPNPYQRVLAVVGCVMERLDHDCAIPVYGFGDKSSRDDCVFPMARDGDRCHGFAEVLESYGAHASTAELGGPTRMAPIVEKAIEIVESTGSYHILLVLTDGQFAVDDARDLRAIVDASRHPISIVVIGVGDGPWNVLREYDDKLLSRHFDNLQFVSYHDVVSNCVHEEAALALHILMEIPDQYASICALGYLERAARPDPFPDPRELEEPEGEDCKPPLTNGN